MSVELPDPVPLGMPPGDVAGLTEVVQDVAGAAFQLNVLTGALSGPAASAPGWLGDDAMAAAEQVGATARLAARAAEAVLAAMHRLSAHAECLQEARRRVATLVQEQQEDFRAVAVRQSQVADPRLAVMTGAPEWVGPLDDLRAAEESRRRRHGAVLEEVADDAAATARVLARSCTALGGSGTRADAGDVLAYFAAQLPGWGDRELAGRGRVLADAFVHEWLTPQQYDERARDVAALAGSPAFADAFLADLGDDGFRALLGLVGDGDFGADSPLPRLLAAVLAAAGPDGFTGAAAAVVQTPYVDPRDPDVGPDHLVLGMGVVLAAAARPGSRSLPSATVVAWGRQIILREQVQGAAAVARVDPMMTTHAEVDAVPVVVELLRRSDDPGAAAGLLAAPEIWSVLLSRSWDDCGAGLDRVVHLAGSEPGPDGGTALGAGLEALGTGLEDGDPDGWTVTPAAARAIARPLAEGLALHWAVPAGLLAAVADGETSDPDKTRLRGLGYLTIDERAASSITEAVTRWVAHQPPAVGTTDLAVLAVPAAHLAVQEYGQRLAHALHGFELQAAAELRQLEWTVMVTLPSMLVGGRLNPVVAALEPIAARAFGADGRWDNGVDRGAVFLPQDAARDARAHTPVTDRAEVAALTARVRAAFDETISVLGRPRPPKTPPADPYWILTGLEGVSGGNLARSEELLKAMQRALD